ncbi:lipopolysaccharide ABC transporter substrate-binding protein LptA [Edwardsiella ictaluri]|uniref:Lipopolysaccharide export system protein LptA n=2 Tax=Edwardsiella ictaluri TaxID=67780 RepID=C5B730_EDWI9|nr:lipopolysaccharide ABC transporter substrate-binding protein LptA [Edwardsiella ictaluri]ACR67804.1 cell envelope biogenesis protein YhbN, putative [Edwardsiella ictaluri 93-146]AVZ81746.1 lipopolysaccharide ABC transporter substrate-binding protein LptA [Edwardsiella ictaluri]EKS7763070.1 lipopolysaccharide ABC transporter substrate-binding protein LptA [Edwardsiella ictaluri]EKS7770359.1 lipopolysaccharide ABC transporter substrate-binding protein LptA [Edwardsiella ictaluri]EKS7773500.1 
MKFKASTLKLRDLILAGALLSASASALAVTGDTDQPIHINSMQQSLDMQGNVATFTGDVIVTQGTIKITADKVVITRPNGQQGSEIVEAYGNPVTFYQMQDNGKPVEGHSQQLRYELAKDYVILTGKAFLKQLDSNIEGDRITYLVKQQQMEAFSDKGKRVTTVLLPSQLQDKGSAKPAPQKKSN